MLENENSNRPILCGLLSTIYPPFHTMSGDPTQFSLNGVIDKVPFHTILILFANIVADHGLFCKEHTFSVILIFIPISHTLLQISPPFCVPTIPHNF